MLSFRWVRIIKLVDILCICVGIGSILFGPSLIGKTASKILTVLMLVIMLVLKPIICRTKFVCPHCGGRDILKGVGWYPERDDVIRCPHCGKPILFV